jgi:hypothetical protein
MNQDTVWPLLPEQAVQAGLLHLELDPKVSTERLGALGWRPLSAGVLPYVPTLPDDLLVMRLITALEEPGLSCGGWMQVSGHRLAVRFWVSSPGAESAAGAKALHDVLRELRNADGTYILSKKVSPA